MNRIRSGNDPKWWSMCAGFEENPWANWLTRVRSRVSRRLLAVLLAVLVPGSIVAQVVSSVDASRINLSVGRADGVKTGMTGRVVSSESVGGVSVQVVLAVFRVEAVQPRSSTAVIVRGETKNVTRGMEVVIDTTVRSELERSATRPGTRWEPSGFVEIPSGAFVMGCAEGDRLCDPDEGPSHSVVISASFFMAAAETTNSQYRECVRKSACSEPHASPHLFRNHGFDQVPVLGVTWEQARDYCAFSGGRLPTEAEWEFAAIGGSRTPRIFPWGDDPPSCWSGGRNGARFDDDQSCDDSGPSVVGSFEPNEYGLFDLAGNAWEWTSDVYEPDYYSSSPRRDPKGPAQGEYRVVRGGSWSSSGKALRNSNRLAVRKGDTSANIGFRCVKAKQ